MKNREASTIYLKTEFEFVPIDDGRFGEEFIRELFLGLSKPGMTEFAYKNLSLQDDPPRLYTTRITERGKSRSTCEISPHSIEIEEDSVAGVDIGEFQERAKSIITAANEVATRLKRPIPPVFTQRVCVQTVVQPSEVPDSLDLLAGKAARVLDLIDPFRRPPSYFGIRFRFIPHEPDNENGEEPPFDGWDEAQDDFVTLRFETWSNDPSYVWIEVSSSRILSGAIDLDEHGTDRVCQNIARTYDFLQKNAIDFIGQFDRKDDDKGDDDEADSTES